jgi:FKBP-type peptidyl-prolyl cis-trans isomerase FkpA
MVFAATALSLSACRDKPVQPAQPPAPTLSPPADIATTTFAPALNVDLKSATKTASGLYYHDITVGTGPGVTAGKQVSVNYTGWFPNGEMFETSPAPIVFVVGIRRVIAGWDEGLIGMRVGGTRQLIIPAALAYGAEGSPPKIPANAILVFNVEVTDVK